MPGFEQVGPRCRLREADGTKIPPPTSSWTSCGEGCERFDIDRTFGRPWPVASTLTEGGGESPMLALGGGARGERAYQVRMIMRLDEARVVAMLSLEMMVEQAPDGATYAPGQVGQSRESALQVTFSGSDEVPVATNKLRTWGRAPTRPDRPWLWATPLVPQLPPGLMVVDIDAGTSSAVFCGNVPVTLASLESTTWTSLPGTTSLRCAGQGETIIWSHGSATGLAFSDWSAKTGVRPVASGLIATGATALSLSPTHAVAVVEDGDEDTTPQLAQWRPDAADPGATFQLSPPIALGGPVSSSQTWGDHAVLMTRPPDFPLASFVVTLVHLPSGKRWVVPPSADGHGIHPEGVTLTSSHLYVSEYEGKGADSASAADRVVRWQLDTLTSQAPLSP